MTTDVVQTSAGSPKEKPKARATSADSPKAIKQASGAVADKVGRMNDVRTGLQVDELQQAITDHLRFSVGRLASVATPEHYYRALALAVRDRMQGRWINTTQTYFDFTRKVACYLSAEFLMGPQLGNNLLNLHIEQEARSALAELGQDLDTVLACEEEPGLGNGGLGRLAACYIDSLATLQRPAIGYGIRYEFGIFDQEIRDGWQVEKTDNWLVSDNPWEIAKPDVAYLVSWGGHTERYFDGAGNVRVRWVPHRVIKGIAYDTPIQGYDVNTCNTLRLWSARAVDSFALEAFNSGDYYRAVEDKIISETVTKVLYPNDEPEIGKRLRLAQQHFFVSCSLQDALQLLEKSAGQSVRALPEFFAFQLNDTHPSIAVAELMRLLVDERDLGWDEAWAITGAAFGYTNHTCCRKRWKPGRCRCSNGSCRGTWRSSMRSTTGCSTRFSALAGRRGAGQAHVADRGAGPQDGAHGASGDSRQPRGQRRGCVALRVGEDPVVPDFLRDVAGTVSATRPTV